MQPNHISFVMSGNPIISVAQLSKRYGEVRAVDDISFEVGPGSVTALLGANARPHFVQGSEGPSLSPDLPPEWGDLSKRLRSWPLVDTDAGPADDAQSISCRDDVRCDLGARTDHQSVVVTDDRFQLFRAETRALIDLSHLAQDVDAGLINGVGNQNFCHQPAKDCRGPL